MFLRAEDNAVSESLSAESHSNNFGVRDVPDSDQTLPPSQIRSISLRRDNALFGYPLLLEWLTTVYSLAQFVNVQRQERVDEMHDWNSRSWPHVIWQTFMLVKIFQGVSAFHSID